MLWINSSAGSSQRSLAQQDLPMEAWAWVKAAVQWARAGELEEAEEVLDNEDMCSYHGHRGHE